MILFRQLLILLCVLSIGACKEDYSYPNVLTELTEVQTDGNGMMKTLTTDRGEAFTIAKCAQAVKLTADSLYRMLTVFEPLEGSNNHLLLHAAQPVFSEYPIPVDKFEDNIKTDPVDIQSIWRSGNYLNMILHVQTKDKKHEFHFVENGIYPYELPKGGTNTKEGSFAGDEGRQMLEISLYHDRKDDYEAFTSKYCFSIPLKRYEGKLKKGDVIRLNLNTYKEGNTYRDFEF